MKTRNLTILAVLVFLSGSIFAQGNYNGQGQRGQADRFMDIPDLTDAQKTKITDLRASNMKEMLPLRNKLKEKQAHLNTISTGDNVNMTDVNKTIGEVGTIKIEMAKKRASHRQEIRKILTDNQRVFFDMHSDKKRNKHMKNKGNGNKRGMK